ncbi:MAG: putative manganese-dependent inorganic diphosphatase [Verrucomicrobia bacterium]|nr:putative manganese-dependent inorganic diphosphatase [Verrucomicrobiota bacterium]
MREVLVIGHRNPDTDSICSAIGYAEFKRRTGLPEAVAARCGDTNERIDFVLSTFQTPAPRFVADISPRIRDVMRSDVVSVSPRTTVAEALGIMDEKDIRVLPVLREDRTCNGLISVYKMSKILFPTPNRPFDSRRVRATVRNLSRTLTGELIVAVRPDQEEDLILMVGAMTASSFSERLSSYPSEKIVVVVGDRLDIQALAIRERVRVVVITGGLPAEANVIEEAKKNGVSLIISPHDSATTALLSRSSITVEHVLHEKFLSFREDEMLSDARLMASSSSFQAFPVIDQNKHTVGILTKTDLLKPFDRKLILVDHNELSQAIQGADQVEILEVVDHHRIGLTTPQPILFRNEPVGSTSTIVADCFLSHNIEIPWNIAGLLLAGLISDTLNLTSPTTTKKDSDVLAILEKRANVNAREFTEKLFASGSVLISKPGSQAITTDCKEYVEQERRFSVAQIEELGFDQFWKRKTEVCEALKEYKEQNSYFFSALLVTDVVRQKSLLVVAGPEHFLRLMGYPEIESGIFELKEVVSRKKQLLPYLSHTLRRHL